MFKSIIRLLVTILITIAFAFLMITYVGERTKVSGHSMEPQLHDQDQVLLDKLTYCFRNPEKIRNYRISWSRRRGSVFCETSDRTSGRNCEDRKRKSLCEQ